MSTEADIDWIWCYDNPKEAAELIARVRAERDAAAQDMRERCAKVAERFYDVEVAPDQEKHKGVGLLVGEQIAGAIRALTERAQPADPVIATDQTSGAKCEACDGTGDFQGGRRALQKPPCPRCKGTGRAVTITSQQEKPHG